MNPRARTAAVALGAVVVLTALACGGATVASEDAALRDRLSSIVSTPPPEGRANYEAIDSSGLLSLKKFSATAAERKAFAGFGFKGAFGRRWKNIPLQSEGLAMAISLRDTAGAHGMLDNLRVAAETDPTDAVPRSIEFADEAWELEADAPDGTHVAQIAWRRGTTVVIVSLATLSARIRGRSVRRWAEDLDRLLAKS